MRTIILSLYSPSFYLLAAAKRQELTVGKDDHANFQTTQDSKENSLYFVKKRNKRAGAMSQSRVKRSRLLIDREADRLNFQRVCKDWTPNLTLDQ